MRWVPTGGGTHRTTAFGRRAGGPKYGRRSTTGAARPATVDEDGGPVATQVIDIVKATDAPPAAVYALVADGATWPAWSPIADFSLERPGAETPVGDGVGAIRVFTTPQPVGPATVSREEVVEAVLDERFAYVMLSGLPLRKYRATIELTPTPSGGTSIHWTSTFEGAFPGAGPFFKWALGRFLRGIVDNLAARAAASPAGTA